MRGDGGDLGGGAFGLRVRLREPSGLGEGALGPLDGAGVVPAAEREPPQLLTEVRALDVLGVRREEGEARLVARHGERAVARLPEQPPALAMKPRLGGQVPDGLVPRPRPIVVVERRLAPAGERHEIAEALAHRRQLGVRALARLERRDARS